MRRYKVLRGGASFWLIVAGTFLSLSMIDNIVIAVELIFNLNIIPMDVLIFYNEYIDILLVFLGCFAVVRGIYLQFITSQELSEQIAISELKYRKLYKEIPIGIFTYDIDGNIIDINSSALDFLDSSSEHVTKQINLFNFPPLRESGLSQDLLKSIIEEEEVIAEKVYISKWGKKHFYDIKYCRLRMKIKMLNMHCVLLKIS